MLTASLAGVVIVVGTFSGRARRGGRGFRTDSPTGGPRGSRHSPGWPRRPRGGRAARGGAAPPCRDRVVPPRPARERFLARRQNGARRPSPAGSACRSGIARGGGVAGSRSRCRCRSRFRCRCRCRCRCRLQIEGRSARGGLPGIGDVPAAPAWIRGSRPGPSAGASGMIESGHSLGAYRNERGPSRRQRGGAPAVGTRGGKSRGAADVVVGVIGVENRRAERKRVDAASPPAQAIARGGIRSPAGRAFRALETASTDPRQLGRPARRDAAAAAAPVRRCHRHASPPPSPRVLPVGLPANAAGRVGQTNVSAGLSEGFPPPGLGGTLGPGMIGGGRSAGDGGGGRDSAGRGMTGPSHSSRLSRSGKSISRF